MTLNCGFFFFFLLFNNFLYVLLKNKLRFFVQFSSAFQLFQESVLSRAVGLSETALGEAPMSPRIFCLFMQMEICSSTLASYIGERDRCGQAVDLKFNSSVIQQVAAGLSSIHGLGLVHRDVKVIDSTFS